MTDQLAAMPRYKAYTSFPRSCVEMQTSLLLSLGMGSHAGAWEPEKRNTKNAII